ncbi:arginine--tRNA ligase [Patescibacteria group bacterium]|nr:arginine--tRNA ligase [Patescibacteria group bacterium]
MNFKLNLQKKIERAIVGIWPRLRENPVVVDINHPPEDKFGDYSSNIAMQLTSIAQQSPLAIAEAIKDKLGKVPAINRIEIVPPGFLNFYLDDKWLARQMGIIQKEKNKFGQSNIGGGRRVLLEYVSANPTGPVTMANGRGAFAGDTLANIMKLSGYTVLREYYMNDIGNQVNILAESVLRRYWINQGIKMEYPDYCYQGEYINDLAKRINLPNYKLNNIEKIEVVRDKIKSRILQKMISDIKKVLEKKLIVHYDRWYSEKMLYTSGQVDQVLRLLKGRGLLYKFEGAIWLKMKKFGDSQDHVLIKANEDPTYFLSEVAYLWNKFVKRKINKYILFVGADHHGHAARIQRVHRMLEFSGTTVVILMQMVRLMRRGQEVKMSKRSGIFITLEELADEVGLDATRFFFLMHDFNTHMDFDMDLARKKSKDNPVFYVQYAHARICSIMEKAKTLAATPVPRGANLELAKAEKRLIKQLIRWPELVAEVAQNYQVHRIPFFAIEVATIFHEFYTQCQVIQGKQYNGRRMQLVNTTRIVLQNILSSMGINAPAKM